MAEVNALLHKLRAKHPLSAARFANCFSQFLQVSDEYKYMAEHMARLLGNGKLLKVLDIGAGVGTLWKNLQIDVRQRVGTYVGLEMNPEIAAQLKVNIKELLPACENPVVKEIRWNPDNTTLEDWDVVLMCHSLYDMPNRLLHVQAAMHLVSVERGGILVIFHRKNDIGKLAERLGRDLEKLNEEKNDEKWSLQTFNVEGGLRLRQDVRNDDVLSINYGLDMDTVEHTEKEQLRQYFDSQCMGGSDYYPSPAVCLCLQRVVHKKPRGSTSFIF